jgi:hypothetical protein
MAARYGSGYLVSRRRGALSHAEALATGGTPSPGIGPHPEAPYTLVICGSPRYFFLFVLRQIKDAIGGCGVSLFLDREQVSHASSARAGRSRQSPAEVGRSTRGAPRTALVTAPFLVGRSLEPSASGRFNRLRWLIRLRKRLRLADDPRLSPRENRG